jgi:voltage-gated potassium channel
MDVTVPDDKAWPARARHRAHHIIEAGIGHSTAGTFVHGSLIVLALVNVVACAAYSVPDIKLHYGALIHFIDYASAAIFAVEYVLRIWSSTELPFFAASPAWKARAHFAMRPMQIVDLMAFLPTLIGLLMGLDLWAAMMLRFLKVARYSPALHSLGRVIAAERGSLFGALVIMTGLVMFSATGMYFIEREVQPATFGSIPASIWWAVITLATVGYGDAVPITPLGKLFASLVMIAGLAAFALPFGIIASGFGREATRRDFMVSWLLLARVPLFAGLDPAAVGQIITLLHSRMFDAGEVIVRRGTPGDNMFFVVSGEVVVEADHGEVILREGDFFGEMALLEHRPRSSSVRAVTRVRLLVLDREDLERLGRKHPAILKRIRDTASARRERNKPATG